MCARATINTKNLFGRLRKMSESKRGKFTPTPDEMKVINLLVEGVPAGKAFSKCGVNYHNKSRNIRYRKVRYHAGKLLSNV